MSAEPSATRQNLSEEPQDSIADGASFCISASVAASGCERLTSAIAAGRGPNATVNGLRRKRALAFDPKPFGAAADHTSPQPSAGRRGHHARDWSGGGDEGDVDCVFITTGDVLPGAVERVDQRKRAANLDRLPACDAFLRHDRYPRKERRKPVQQDRFGRLVRIGHRRAVGLCPMRRHAKAEDGGAGAHDDRRQFRHQRGGFVRTDVTRHPRQPFMSLALTQVRCIRDEPVWPAIRLSLSARTHEAETLLMTAVTIDALDLAALLCSRVCHDLISPVGAIVNGLEVLEDDNDEETKTFAMDLIKKSAGAASAKLQFCRIAFGAAGSAGAQIDSGDAEKVARGFLEDEKTKLDWQLPRLLLPKNRIKLLLNMLLIGGTGDPARRQARNCAGRRGREHGLHRHRHRHERESAAERRARFRRGGRGGARCASHPAVLCGTVGEGLRTDRERHTRRRRRRSRGAVIRCGQRSWT